MQVLYHYLVGIWGRWFLWREENQRARQEPTANSSTYGSRPESKLGHMVEAGALTTAPSQCSPMIN